MFYSNVFLQNLTINQFVKQFPIVMESKYLLLYSRETDTGIFQSQFNLLHPHTFKLSAHLHQNLLIIFHYGFQIKIL